MKRKLDDNSTTPKRSQTDLTLDQKREIINWVDEQNSKPSNQYIANNLLVAKIELFFDNLESNNEDDVKSIYHFKNKVNEIEASIKVQTKITYFFNKK